MLQTKHTGFHSMLLPLTEPQRKVFDALVEIFIETGYPPSSREIAEKVGKVSVSSEVQALRRKNWAIKLEGVHRRSTVPSEEAMERRAAEKQENMNFK
jgi:SOS-response transcriptional repressor LexA